MSGTLTLPLSATAPYIDATGIHAPDYQTCLNYLVGKYQAIYGADTYLGNDSQDYEMLSVFALAISDANSVAIALYNAFSPATAQGAGLSSVVKINGIQRAVPSNSNVDLVLVGQAGVPIINGIAQDTNNNRWFLPTPINIPISGQITVTAIAEFAGAVRALAGTVDTIGTPTQGWQSVINLSDAVVGAPIQIDGALRQQQAQSTMIPSLSVLDGLVGDIIGLSGVTRLQPYENKTSLVDANGIPDHSIALVVEGGSAQAIGDLILLKKTPGTGTYGTTSVTSLDAYGNPNLINFFRPIDVPITVVVTLTPLLGYTTDIGALVVNAVINSLVTLPIGTDVIRTRIMAAAYNTGGAAVNTYNISNIVLSRGGATPGILDLAIDFNEAAIADTTTVSLVIG